MKRDWQLLLGRFLRQLQWWLILETWGYVLCRLALVLLPLGALAVMVDQRWFAGAYSVSIALSVLTPLAIIPLGYAFLHRGTRLHQAFEMDERGGLKDRVTSAWEFLSQESLTREQELQVKDALRAAHDVDLPSLLTLKDSRLPAWAFAAFCVFVASFYVPSVYQLPEVEAAADPVRLMQVAEVESLREEIEQLAAEEERLEEVLEKLREVADRFEQGELSERDVMIALARMDKELAARMAEMGVENLSAQFDQVVPHLMAGSASRPVGQAIQADEFDQAAEELDALEARLREDGLTPEEREQLARNMGAAAAKLGTGGEGSLGADFDAASKAMESGDPDGARRAFESIKGKLGQCDSLRAMKSARNGLGMSKASLGNKASMQAKISQNESNALSDKSSISAGKGSAEALGEEKRQESYHEMLQVQGMAGDGPVQREVEVTEGQTSPRQRQARDVYNEYAAVAEQALDGEAIPLSHRFHVKRYFQAIRPEE